MDTLSGTATLVGLVGSESFALTGTGTGTLANKNAGTEAVTASVALGTASGGALTSNYILTEPSLSSVTIGRAPLTITAATDSKTYDGNTTSLATPTVTTGQVFSGDSLTGLSQSFNSPNALGNNGSTLTVSSGYTLNDGNNNGGNYQVTLATANGTISQKALTVTGLSGTNRT